MSKIYKKSQNQKDDKNDQSEDKNEDGDDLDRDIVNCENEVKRGLRIQYPAIEVEYQDQDLNEIPFR